MDDSVSVIIPTYNGERFLGETVDSVIRQVHKNWECIIIDDGSTDNTRKVCEDLKKRDSRISYYLIPNIGNYAARNYGIKKAKGSWIQNLDHDDWLHPEKISRQLSFLANHSTYNASDNVILYCDYECVYFDDHGKLIKKIKIIPGQMTNYELLKKISKWSFTTDLPTPHWTLLIKSKVIKNNLYSEKKKYDFADVELVTKYLIDEIPFIYTPVTGYFYRIHNAQYTQRNWEITKNAYIEYLKFVQKYDKKWLRYNKNYEMLLKFAVSTRNKENFKTIVSLADAGHYKLKIYGITCHNKQFIKILLYYYSVLHNYLRYYITHVFKRFGGRLEKLDNALSSKSV